MTCQTYGGKYEHSASMLALAGFLTYIGAFQFAVGYFLFVSSRYLQGWGPRSREVTSRTGHKAGNTIDRARRSDLDGLSLKRRGPMSLERETLLCFRNVMSLHFRVRTPLDRFN